MKVSIGKPESITEDQIKAANILIVDDAPVNHALLRKTAWHFDWTCPWFIGLFAIGMAGAVLQVSPDMPKRAATLRRLGWELEGTGVSIVVAPGLTDVAGPRIQVRPVGSRLPLLEVDEPEFAGARKLLAP